MPEFGPIFRLEFGMISATLDSSKKELKMTEKKVPIYKVIFAVLLYWCTSWGAIFMNKYVVLIVFYARYVYTKRNFEAEYFITFVQFIAPSVTLYLFSKLNKKVKLVPTFPDIK